MAGAEMYRDDLSSSSFANLLPRGEGQLVTRGFSRRDRSSRFQARTAALRLYSR